MGQYRYHSAHLGSENSNGGFGPVFFGEIVIAKIRPAQEWDLPASDVSKRCQEISLSIRFLPRNLHLSYAGTFICLCSRSLHSRMPKGLVPRWSFTHRGSRFGQTHQKL